MAFDDPLTHIEHSTMMTWATARLDKDQETQAERGCSKIASVCWNQALAISSSAVSLAPSLSS